MKPNIESIETDTDGQPVRFSVKTDERTAFVSFVACIVALHSVGQDPNQWEGELERVEGDILRLTFRRKPAPVINN
jgi:hypothetical protein